jgi:hypothetical protein
MQVPLAVTPFEFVAQRDGVYAAHSLHKRANDAAPEKRKSNQFNCHGTYRSGIIPFRDESRWISAKAAPPARRTDHKHSQFTSAATVDDGQSIRVP